MRRWVWLSAVAVAVLFGAAVIVPALSSAQAGLTVSADRVDARDYGPIVAQNPSGEVTDPVATAPSDCAVQTYCDVIPLRVDLPDEVGANDEVFVKVTMTYDQPAVATPLGDEGTNELDLQIWAEPEGDAPITTVYGYTQPVVATLFQPTARVFNVVVINSLGTNTGYRLEAKANVDHIEAPFEARPVTRSPGASPTPSPTSNSVLAPTFSGTRAPQSLLDGSLTGPNDASVALSPAAIPLDPDLAADDVGGDTVGGPELASILPKRTRPPTPAAPALIAWWLVITPIAAVVGGQVWLRRRRPSELRDLRTRPLPTT